MQKVKDRNEALHDKMKLLVHPAYTYIEGEFNNASAQSSTCQFDHYIVEI